MAANRRRSAVLSASAAALPAIVVGVVLGVVVGAAAGAAGAVVVFAAVWALVSRTAMTMALGLIGGGPVPDGQLLAVANQMDGLCATLGVARPQLWLVDEAVAGACALDGLGGHGVVVVTSGLVERLGLIEMEGVLAHELVHLKRGDAVVSAVAVATAGLFCWLLKSDALLHAALGRGREYGADQAAALAVRYPPGLRDALAVMGEHGGPVPRAASVFSGRRWAGTRWIWIDPMVGASERAPVGEIDATEARRAALAEW